MTVKVSTDWREVYESWMDEKALRLFSEGESITSVCCDLDISRETYYRWRDDKSHPFCKIAKKGESLSQQWWERKGQQAIFGDKDCKFAGSPWMFVLKNRFKESYSDLQPVTNALTAIEQLLKGKD